MRLRVDRHVEVLEPTFARVRQALGRLDTVGKKKFLVVEDEARESFVQVAGGKLAFVVERGGMGRLERAHTETPVVSFEDGTTLGRISLLHDEWLSRDQALALLRCFLEEAPFPPEVGWRDYTSLLEALGPATWPVDA